MKTIVDNVLVTTFLYLQINYLRKYHAKRLQFCYTCAPSIKYPTSIPLALASSHTYRVKRFEDSVIMISYFMRHIVYEGLSII